MAAAPTLAVALFALGDAGVGAAVDMNGAPLGIDLARPVDHIEEVNKVVVTAAMIISVDGTVAHILHVYSNGAAAVTVEHLQTALPSISVFMAKVSLYKLGTKCGWALTMRTSDVILMADFNGRTHAAAHTTFARGLLNGMTNAHREQVYGLSDMVSLAAVGNAVHRKQHDGHSWFSNKGDVKGTSTNRTLAVAGAKAENFGNFMRDYGHDVHHILTDGSLDDLAGAMVGSSIATCAAEVEYAGVTYPIGTAMHDMLLIGDAAKDRFPSGMMGKASLIVGLSHVSAMVTDVQSKVVIVGAPDLVTGVIKLKHAISTMEVPRVQLQGFKTALADVIAVAYGYYQANIIASATGKLSPALDKFARANGSSMALGGTVYARVKEIAANKDAVAGVLASTMRAIADAIVAATNLPVGAGPAPDAMWSTMGLGAPPVLVAIEVPDLPPTAAEAAAAVNAAQMERMMNLVTARAADT